MNKNTQIGFPGGDVNNEHARRKATEAITDYKRDVKDIDFGNETNERLFRNYLAEHASGSDTMRGYFAAFNRH